MVALGHFFGSVGESKRGAPTRREGLPVNSLSQGTHGQSFPIESIKQKTKIEQNPQVLKLLQLGCGIRGVLLCNCLIVCPKWFRKQVERRAFGSFLACRLTLASNAPSFIISVPVGPCAASEGKCCEGGAEGARCSGAGTEEADKARKDPAGRISARVSGCDFR